MINIDVVISVSFECSNFTSHEFVTTESSVNAKGEFSLYFLLLLKCNIKGIISDNERYCPGLTYISFYLYQFKIRHVWIKNYGSGHVCWRTAEHQWVNMLVTTTVLLDFIFGIFIIPIDSTKLVRLVVSPAKPIIE